MSDFFRFLGWLFINVGVPLLAPLALLPLLTLSRSHQTSVKRLVLNAIQDGQLCWTAIAMCAGACYDVGGMLDVSTSGSTRAFAWIGLAWHILLVIGSSALMLIGTMNALYVPTASARTERPNRRVMWVSVFLTVTTATSFSISHYLVT
ncbi:MAG TPA: hypothetical protein VEI25_00225 [Paraburkholderia sp.]|nr:hypothetical protein [Paraburkholderia sp.]